MLSIFQWFSVQHNKIERKPNGQRITVVCRCILFLLIIYIYFSSQPIRNECKPFVRTLFVLFLIFLPHTFEKPHKNQMRTGGNKRNMITYRGRLENRCGTNEWYSLNFTNVGFTRAQSICYNGDPCYGTIKSGKNILSMCLPSTRSRIIQIQVCTSGV